MKDEHGHQVKVGQLVKLQPNGALYTIVGINPDGTVALEDYPPGTGYTVVCAEDMLAPVDPDAPPGHSVCMYHTYEGPLGMSVVTSAAARMRACTRGTSPGQYLLSAHSGDLADLNGLIPCANYAGDFEIEPQASLCPGLSLLRDLSVSHKRASPTIVLVRVHREKPATIVDWTGMAVSQRKKYPIYRCFKQVEAFKIASVQRVGEGAILAPEDPSLANWCVTPEYVKKHDPKPGGYWVRYADGYQSFSPADAFEGGSEERIF